MKSRSAGQDKGTVQGDSRGSSEPESRARNGQAAALALDLKQPAARRAGDVRVRVGTTCGRKPAQRPLVTT